MSQNLQSFAVLFLVALASCAYSGRTSQFKSASADPCDTPASALESLSKTHRLLRRALVRVQNQQRDDDESCAENFDLIEHCKAGKEHLFWKALRKESAFYLPHDKNDEKHPIYKNYPEIQHPFLQKLFQKKGDLSGFEGSFQNASKALKISSEALQKIRTLFPNWKNALQKSQLPLIVSSTSLLSKKELLPQIVRCIINVDPSKALDFDFIARTVKKHNIQLSVHFLKDLPEAMHKQWGEGLKKLFETGRVSELSVGHDAFALNTPLWRSFIEGMSNLDQLKSFSYDLHVTCQDFCDLIHFLSDQGCPIVQLAFGEMRADNTHRRWVPERLRALPELGSHLEEVVFGSGFSSAGNILMDVLNVLPKSLSHILTQDDQNEHIKRTISASFMKKLVQRFDQLVECQFVADFIKNTEVCQALSANEGLKSFGVVLRTQNEIDSLTQAVKNMKALEVLEIHLAIPQLQALAPNQSLIQALSGLSSFQTLRLFPKEVVRVDRAYMEQFMHHVVVPFLSAGLVKIDLAFTPYLQCVDEIRALSKKYPQHAIESRLSVCGFTLDEMCHANNKREKSSKKQKH